MSDDSMAQLDALREEAEGLLRELARALQDAYFTYKPPRPVALSFDGKFRAVATRISRFVDEHPDTREYFRKLTKATEDQRKAMLKSAEQAHQKRGPAPAGAKQRYNGIVGKGAAGLVKDGTKAAEREVDRMVRRLVDAVISEPKVPGHAKAQIATSLATWIKRQDATQDAFYVVETCLRDVAGFLHQKLTFQAEITHVRDTLARKGQVTPQEAAEADKRVGELAKRSLDLDRQIQRRIQQSTLKVKANLSISPKLVLDPTKAFLGAIHARAGITIRQHGVTVDIGTRLKVIDPLSTRDLAVQPYVGVQKGNMHLGVEGEADLKNGQKPDYSIKAQITWTF